MRRSKSVRVIQSEFEFKMSTPKPRRLSSLMEQRESQSQLSVESLNDWSMISGNSDKSYTSMIENSLKRVKSSRKKFLKKMKISKSQVREKVWNRISSTQIQEIGPDYPTGEFNSQLSTRIISSNELPSFEDYDFVVWNISPEKKKKRKFIDFFKRKSET